MLKKISISVMLFIGTICFSNDKIEAKKLYYEKINPSNVEDSQKKVNLTYTFGIEILQETIKNIKNKTNYDKKQLLEECDESLYLAIFDKTIVDNLNRKESKKRFMEDCIKIVNSL